MNLISRCHEACGRCARLGAARSASVQLRGVEACRPTERPNEAQLATRTVRHARTSRTRSASEVA